ncbi:hypothetical protein EV714DRAFT_240481 [Schizophyllum commune]
MDSTVLFHLQRNTGRRDSKAMEVDDDEAEPAAVDELPPPVPMPQSVEGALIPSLAILLWLLYLCLNQPAENKPGDPLILVEKGANMYHCTLCPALLAHLTTQNMPLPKHATKFRRKTRLTRYLTLAHSGWKQNQLAVFRDEQTELLQCPGCVYQASTFTTLTAHMLGDCINQPHYDMLYEDHRDACARAKCRPQSEDGGISIIEQDAPNDSHTAEIIAYASSILDDVDVIAQGADLHLVIPSFEQMQSALDETMPDDPVTAAMEEAVGLLADGYEPITVEEWWDIYFDCAG